MSKWIAEFDLEDGDTMPEHMDLEYKGAKIDFHCRPLEQEPILDKIRAEIGKSKTKHELQLAGNDIKGKLLISDIYCDIVNIFGKYNAESEDK